MEDLERKMYIVMVKPTEEVERLSRQSRLTRLNQEQRVAISDARGKSLTPLCEYLNQQGLQEGRDYSVLKNIGTVTVQLTVPQATEIRKLPYVQEMTEDFKMELIE